MRKVVIFNVEIYDRVTDESKLSPRMATRKGAALIGGDVIEESATLVDDGCLEAGTEWTAAGFVPAENV